MLFLLGLEKGRESLFDTSARWNGSPKRDSQK
jgi:hypothetical protein